MVRGKGASDVAIFRAGWQTDIGKLLGQVGTQISLLTVTPVSNPCLCDYSDKLLDILSTVDQEMIMVICRLRDTADDLS
jgi:hypothetical protein